jgi:catechol 2,3-dioxygenase-like lactoylglutathione lyase family enzyme
MAQSAAMGEDGRPLDHVYYWTRDMDRAVAFYGEVLGLPLLRREDDQWALFDAGPVQFALHGSIEGHPVAPGGATAVFRVDDLDGAVRALQERGVEFHDHLGEVAGFARFRSFSDPDGNTVQLIEYVAR